ncbi:MAG TPA: hypothetical protein VIG99_04950 [Myxococcaceae bacterium]
MDEGTDDVGQIQDEARAAPPTGKNLGLLSSKNQCQAKTIEYHGGPVMTGTPDVYVIWYGNWSNAAASQSILSDFLTEVGGSPYFQLNARYTNGSGQGPSGSMLFGGSVTDAYSHGTALSDADLADVVARQINTNGLPQDPGGIYVVIASPDVTATSGFCSRYCGQHGSGEALGSPFRFIFVGNASRCMSTCAYQRTVSPNGNPAADAMVNILANELSTTVTDPTLGAWHDRSGLENADKCAWNFGTTYSTSNGAKANIRLGGRDYLIQQNFWPTSRGGVCVMSSSQAAAAVAAGLDRHGP